MSTEPEKKLFVDEDWKSQVEAERAAAEAKKAEADAAKSESENSEEAASEKETGEAAELKSDSSSPGETAPDEKSRVPEMPANEEIGVHELPTATFNMLISTLTSEAMVSLGHMANPSTGKAHVNLEYAKYFIDTLNILEEKTQGNLTPDEKTGLETILNQLRMAFVAAKNEAAKESIEK